MSVQCGSLFANALCITFLLFLFSFVVSTFAPFSLCSLCHCISAQYGPHSTAQPTHSRNIACCKVACCTVACCTLTCCTRTAASCTTTCCAIACCTLQYHMLHRHRCILHYHMLHNCMLHYLMLHHCMLHYRMLHRHRCMLYMYWKSSHVSLRQQDRPQQHRHCCLLQATLGTPPTTPHSTLQAWVSNSTLPVWTLQVACLR